jgi:hypothetical protein
MEATIRLSIEYRDQEGEIPRNISNEVVEVTGDFTGLELDQITRAVLGEWGEDVD